EHVAPRRAVLRLWRPRPSDCLARSLKYLARVLKPATARLRRGRLDDHDASAILAEMMRSGSATGSPRLILSTFPMPSVTSPQTVYLPLRKGASAKQMKNWLSPESGDCARAIDTVPRRRGPCVELRLELLAGAAGAGAVGTAGLRHEPLDDTVKRDAIVEALAHQFLDACDMARGEVRPHQNHDLALGGLQRQRILGVRHGMFSACLSFRLSMSRMVNGRPAIAFPSASVNGKGVQRLSILATAMR